MKKLFIFILTIVVLCTIFYGCESKKELIEDNSTLITKETAYNVINKYCHDNYDWSVAQDNPSIMYVEMGNETESDYQIIFKSYTGSFVYFYVDKTSGETKVVEYVPNLDIENELDSINIFDYIDK